MKRLLFVLLLAIGLFGGSQSARTEVSLLRGDDAAHSAVQLVASRFLHNANALPQLASGSEDLPDDLAGTDSFLLLPDRSSRRFAMAGANRVASLLFAHYAIRAPPTFV
jgi:hypothetical protein